MVCLRSVSRGSCKAGHGHSQIQWKSESVAMHRGQYAFLAFVLGVYGVKGIPGAVYIPSGDEFHDGGASGVGLLGQFPYTFEHGEGEATDVLFVG